MSYLTDRKRAEGMGSAKGGTHHHWMMIVSAVALIPLTLIFVFTFASTLGGTYDEAVATFSRPFPALSALLMILVGMFHLKGGMETLVEDYSRGLVRKALVIGISCITYGAAVAGAYALIRIAL